MNELRGGFRYRIDGRPATLPDSDESAMQGAIGIIVFVGILLGVLGDSREGSPVYERSEARFPTTYYLGSQAILRISEGDPVAS